MKIYFTFDPRPDLKSPLIEAFPQVNFVFDRRLNEQQLENTDVLVTYGEDLNDEKIAIAKQLKWIFVASAGIEKMPAKAIAERNILVSNVRGIHKKPMAESVLAHILSIKRALPYMYDNKRNKLWEKKGRPTELNGSTALILGPGAIGGEIGRLLQAFDVYTIGCNKSGNPAFYMDETVPFSQLNEQLPKADLVISVLPSTKETKNLIKYEHFQLMKKNAIFMNFGRGDLVETKHIIRALEEELIFHAVLDVFDEEPLPLDNPLWEMDNVSISPHCSSLSSRYLERSFEIFHRSLANYLIGDLNIENKMDILRGY